MRIMTSGEIKVLEAAPMSAMAWALQAPKVLWRARQGVLTAFGEPEIKTFVRASIDDALKLRGTCHNCDRVSGVVVLHYSPVAGTVTGQSPEILLFMGTSRLAELIDRHGADLVVRGHAHHGTLEEKTTAGFPFTTSIAECTRKLFPGP